MTQIHLHIGPDALVAERMQALLASARSKLAKHGVLYPRSPGGRNHTRLFMCATPADQPDSLRHARGFGPADAQRELQEETLLKLQKEITAAEPDHVILSAHQLGASLHAPERINALREMLAPLGARLHVHAHLDDLARLLARRYGAQILDGRTAPLSLELKLIGAKDYRAAALGKCPPCRADLAIFEDVQNPAVWLDPIGLRAAWDAAFGAGSLRFHTTDEAALFGEHGLAEVGRMLDLDLPIVKSDPAEPPHQPASVWLERSRRMNDVLLRYGIKTGRVAQRAAIRRLFGDLKLPGAPVAAGSLHAISTRFAPDLAALCQEMPWLDASLLEPDAPQADWRVPDPQRGFRPTQYLQAWEWRIKQAVKQQAEEEAARRATLQQDGQAPVDRLLSPLAREAMPELAKKTFVRLRRSSYAPHNRMGMIDETALAAPFTRAQRSGGPRRVIVGCMKNEAPYIVEWVAYHRAIGFDDFVIYTNDCDDGTDTILDRLDALGVVKHRDNDGWRGKSPQQFALNAAIKEGAVREADWLAHIDVDEFINIRCGNGTLDDLFAAVPDVTNIAMTWRLFGHNGVERLQDRPVIEQFDHAAPRYCPKPHTAWGFKTLFRNIGAYNKLACHRPTRLDATRSSEVRWANGSGRDITEEALRNGWRSSRRSVGYDLVQLNHYALRSAESFLIKRQRGRALHVDRSIGLNYWLRMDWGDVRDITIQRNLPRLRSEMAVLLEDPELARLHKAGLAWHRAKLDALHGLPEFAELYEQALALRLNGMERASWALALDMES